ncbi:MAG: hypothetical protein JWO80_5426 [Bryobacterales bacterium]|nr:hypothetical protein [Bryobacterales bacterium]
MIHMIDYGTLQTVILVHGTFAAPKPGTGQWYEPGSAFCTALDARLAALGSPARTWGHVRGMQPIFSWSGRNTWTDRSIAAQAFATYLQDLIGKGWTCHIVAHSHGGNILLQALHLMTDPLNYTIEKYGYSSLVCLGTPFIPPAGRVPINERRSKRELIGSLAVIAAVMIPAWKHIVSSLPGLRWLWIPILLAWMVVIGFLAFSFLLQEPPGGSTPEWKRLLVIGSKRDEVFQLLAQAFRMANPFADRVDTVSSDQPRSEGPSRFARWFKALRNVIAESDRIRYPGRDIAGKGQFGLSNNRFVLSVGSATVAVIVTHTLFPAGGVGTVLRVVMLLAILSLAACAALLTGSMKALVCLPARFLNAAYLFTSAVRGEIIARWFRKYGWHLLRRAALGTNSYPLDVPAASLAPDFLKAEFYHFQELPADVERDALNAREKSLVGTVAELTEAFTQPFATDEILELFEHSPALIHAAYYSYPACVDLIAQWIARTDEALDDQDPRGNWDDGENRDNDKQ